MQMKSIGEEEKRMLARVDSMGVHTSAESIIDIDYGDTAGTGIEHREQRGDSAEGCAVADTGGDSDNWARDEAADYACERAFHSGADNKDIRILQEVEVIEQAMETGDADIIAALHAASCKLEGESGLFRN